MRRTAAWGLVALSGLAVASAAAGEVRMLTPIDFTAVRMEDEFWLPRIELMRDRTLPHVLAWCERTGRLANFSVAAGQVEGQHEGYYFNDSDVYKAIEGAAYLLALYPDEGRAQQLEDLIATIAAAQQDDGYLNTYFQVAKPGERWTNDRFHELYCAGHLFEAGIAYYRATGRRDLLDVAVRFADHIDQVFGPGRRLEAPEHPEIELALVKLWRATGERRYLDLARFFLEQRGRPRGRDGWGEYAQDHVPIQEQRTVVGHAVRAMYLYSAVTDVAAIDGNREYLAALDSLWSDLVGRKLYITGGIGVGGHGEGFAGGFDLPNEGSYAETCASIALAFWSHRLNLLHRDGRYADVLERVLYNAVAASVSLSGDKFFYVNPLASRGVATFRTGGGKEGTSTAHRQEWFRCACCPPNVLRLFPTVGGYIYASEKNSLYVNLYAQSRAQVELAGNTIQIEQQTRYPWDGQVTILLTPRAELEFDLFLRIPGWCRGARLSVNGEALDDLKTDKGYARIRRRWAPGDAVVLELPMPIVRIEADPRVRADAGRLALQRGPIVYCLEEADNPGGVMNLALPRTAELEAEHKPDLLGGVTVIRGTALRRSGQAWSDGLYRVAGPAAPPREAPLTAVPYCVWDNRAPGEMVVWVPEDVSLARELSGAEDSSANP